MTKKALNGIMVLEGEGDFEEILKNKLKRFSKINENKCLKPFT